MWQEGYQALYMMAYVILLRWTEHYISNNVRMGNLCLPLVPPGHTSSLPTASYHVSNQTHLITLTSELKDTARADKHRKKALVFFLKIDLFGEFKH